jgi:PIN domain nuclease of toxin-antitoxin system
VRLLLDTHTLLWWVSGDPQLPVRARRAIASDRHEVLVSAASAWEVTTKYRIGKLPLAGPLVVDFAKAVHAQGFTPLPITMEHGQTAGALAHAHRDPFDRMLVAQALHEQLTIVSNETVFDDLGVMRLW